MVDVNTIGDDDSTAEQEANEVKNHELFITSLQKHGYSSDRKTWERMAKDLGWQEEEVKLYAYRYLLALQVPTEETSGEDTMSINAEEKWTFEESILLEALLVRHLAIINEEDKSDGQRRQDCLSWDELIAARIPGKTAQDVRQRYDQKYRQNGGDDANVITIT